MESKGWHIPGGGRGFDFGPWLMAGFTAPATITMHCDLGGSGTFLGGVAHQWGVAFHGGGG